jgi:hypothetical protein
MLRDQSDQYSDTRGASGLRVKGSKILKLYKKSRRHSLRLGWPFEYKTLTVNNVRLFYREAGPLSSPVILLPHGFPASSRMFATLIPLLANK